MEPNTFTLLWNAEPAGLIKIIVPGRPEIPARYKLEAKGDEASRVYVRPAALADSIVRLCRPHGEHDLVIAQRRAQRDELTKRIDGIEGEVGAITRYLHAHRIALAAWIATLANDEVPVGLEIVVERMRELVQEAAKLRAERAALE